MGKRVDKFVHLGFVYCRIIVWIVEAGGRGDSIFHPTIAGIRDMGNFPTTNLDAQLRRPLTEVNPKWRRQFDWGIADHII
jgi:hypothetical protein